MSLLSVLAGLFPPLNTDVFSDGLNWQPIPFNIDDDADIIRIPSTYCTNYLRQYYKYVLSDEGQEILKTYKDFYQQVSSYTGKDIIVPDDIFDIYETLESEVNQDFNCNILLRNYILIRKILDLNCHPGQVIFFQKL